MVLHIVPYTEETETDLADVMCWSSAKSHFTVTSSCGPTMAANVPK